MTRRTVSLLLGVAVTALVLWFLVTPDVLAEFRAVAAVADWRLLAIALLMSAGVQWLRAWRFGMMTDGVLAFPDARLVRIAFRLNFLNFALPFRLGELGFPVMMQRDYGTPLMRGAGVLLLARLFDLASVGAILCAAAATLGLAGTQSHIALWAAAILLALAPFGMILATRAASPFLHRLLGRFAAPAEDAARNARLPVEIAAIALSFAIWLVFGALAALTAASVGDATTPGIALLGASAGNLAFALPINGVAGLGPSQAAWVAAVTQAGVPYEEAVVGALALYAVTLVAAFLFGGVAMTGGAGNRSRAP